MSQRVLPKWLPETIEEAIRYYSELLRQCGNDKIKIKATKRKLNKGDLFYLLVYTLKRKDAIHPWLFARCREVQANPNGHLDLWSREHYKSTIITFAQTIQDVLNDPEITVGIFSHTRPIAKGFLKQIKREFEGNDDLKYLHDDVFYARPETEAPMWSEEGIIVKRRGNPKEATIEAWGLVDGQPTSKHFKLRVYDDTVTRESVTTPEQIQKTTEAWELSDNLGTEGGQCRYIGTRYHLNDTYAEMMKRDAVIVRRHAATHNGHIDGKPVFFTEDTWSAKKKTQSRKSIAAQLLQNPLASSDALFRAMWLKSYEVRPRLVHIIITVDPSLGKHATSDNTAMSVTALSSTGGRYLVDGYCHRMTLSQRWVALRDLYKKWSRTPGVQCVFVGYERYGAQTDNEYFELKMEEEKHVFAIKELNWAREGGNSKEDRISRLEPDFRNERFYLPLPVWHDSEPKTWSVDLDPESNTYQQVIYREVTGLTTLQQGAIDAGSQELIATAIRRKDSEGQTYDVTLRLIEEFLNFPFGEHDDMLDATSRVYDMDVRPPIYVSKSMTDPATFNDS